MKVKHTYVGWSLWLALWTIFTVIGWGVGALGGLSVHAMAFLCEDCSWGFVENLSLLIQTGVAFGVPVGLTQWLALRQKTTRVGWWVPATAAGFGIYWPVVFVLDHLDVPVRDIIHTPLFGVLFGAGWGLLVGAAQWLILRRRLLKAGWWIVINMGTFVLCGSKISQMLFGDVSTLDVALRSGLVVGVVTGVAMVWLLQYRGSATNTARTALKDESREPKQRSEFTEREMRC